MITVDQLAQQRPFDLSQPYFPGMPCSPNHPGFRLALQRRHGDSVLVDGTSGANEIIVTGGHVGTHIDALCHVSHEGKLHGGIDATEVQGATGFTTLDVESVEPLVGRGVLLDVAAHKGVATLDGGYGITADDLIATSERFGVEVAGAEFVMIRSGWANNFDDPDAYVGKVSGVPGPDESAGEWLAELGIRATGADTIAYEQVHPGSGHATLPVHRILLVETGTHIIEVMNLEPLSRAGVHDFWLFAAPLRLRGATGSPIRPIAWAV